MHTGEKKDILFIVTYPDPYDLALACFWALVLHKLLLMLYLSELHTSLPPQRPAHVSRTIFPESSPLPSLLH